MEKLLSAAEIGRFRSDGVVWPVPVFSAAEVAHFRGKLEEQERLQGGQMRGTLMFKTHLMFRWVDEMIRHRSDVNDELFGVRQACSITSRERWR